MLALLYFANLTLSYSTSNAATRAAAAAETIVRELESIKFGKGVCVSSYSSECVCACTNELSIRREVL